MDKIEFRYRKFSYGMDDYAIPAVEIFINGRRILSTSMAALADARIAALSM